MNIYAQRSLFLAQVTFGIKFHFPKIAKKVEKSFFFPIFWFLGLSENTDFWLHSDILCLHSCVMKIVVVDVISCSDMYNLILKIINAFFLKIDILTLVRKNGHNFACDPYFFLKLTIVFYTNRAIYTC